MISFMRDRIVIPTYRFFFLLVVKYVLTTSRSLLVSRSCFSIFSSFLSFLQKRSGTLNPFTTCDATVHTTATDEKNGQERKLKEKAAGRRDLWGLFMNVVCWTDGKANIVQRVEVLAAEVKTTTTIWVCVRLAHEVNVWRHHGGGKDARVSHSLLDCCRQPCANIHVYIHIVCILCTCGGKTFLSSRPLYLNYYYNSANRNDYIRGMR